MAGYIAETGVCCCPVELHPERLMAEAPAVVGEEELDDAAAFGVAQGAPRRTVLHNTVSQFDRLVVEGHHPFSGQLAQRSLQPGQ